jgi:hypothetical protein
VEEMSLQFTFGVHGHPVVVGNWVRLVYVGCPVVVRSETGGRYFEVGEARPILMRFDSVLALLVHLAASFGG